MDSVTQIALGASVGELVLGRRIGNRALLLGAVVGSLPDLDVLVPFGGAVEDFTYHRSFSHSLIVLTLFAPLLAALLNRLPFGHGATFRQWWLMTWLALVTHPLLDALTVYGTQLFWPLTDYPVSGSIVFIIDPVYTLLLLAGITLALRRNVGAHQWNTAFLCAASAYLVWAAVTKHRVEHRVRQSLQNQSISFDRLLLTPMPLTTLGWRFVAMNESGYLAGYYSLFDPPGHEIKSIQHPSNNQLLATLNDHWPVQRLQYFTHGFYSVDRVDNEIHITDLRMGLERAYIFAFTVADILPDGSVAPANRQAGTEMDFPGASRLFYRLFDPAVELR
ncbi:hypothetical protein AB833_23930 [Chromatiales bacterium (ex Bugula neritina AB1)]|nr:hypothetical protein AB833_23930 [Chromatiales bacterium (ex Bugula neritina AB1)]